MQGLVRAREKPPTQEQWVSMEKQWEEQWKAMKNTGGGRRPVVMMEDRPGVMSYA
jgi:hypothetical protein